VPAALQHPVEDGLGEVLVVEHAAPGRQQLVEDQGPPVQVAVVDHLEEHVRGVGAVARIADLVDHEDVRVSVAGQHVPDLAGPCRTRQVVDR
jgi:hypothetical protein